MKEQHVKSKYSSYRVGLSQDGCITVKVLSTVPGEESKWINESDENPEVCGAKINAKSEEEALNKFKDILRNYQKKG